MSEIDVYGIQHVKFGIDSIASIAAIAGNYGKRILLITEESSGGQDNFDRIQGFLRAAGIDPVVFNDIRPGIKTSVIQTIADIGTAGKVQAVIGLGGMRVLSLARVAAMLIGSGLSLSAVLQGEKPSKCDCAYIEVPTSCRNHFMLRSECVITDSVSERARIISLPSGMTRNVIIDPRLTMATSKKYQLVAILDTLLGAIEGFLSREQSFLSDVYFLEAIRKLQRATGQTYRRPDDIQVRRLASEGGFLASLGLSISGQGIGGALGYMINSAFHVPKSWIAMVMLPHVLDIYAEKDPVRVARIADALGEDISDLQSEQAAPLAAVAARRHLAQLELPTRLRDFNLSLDELYTLCDAVASFPFNHRCGLELTSSDVCELVKRAF